LETCSYVISTTDGAKTWSLLGEVPAPIVGSGQGMPGVSEIRFATAEVGWAFSPDLYRTGDGGRSWQPLVIPGHGVRVLDLAANSMEVYAVVSPCTGFCHKEFTFWRAGVLTGGSWAHVPLDLPASTSADVAVFGQTVYVDDPEGGYRGAANELYASTDGDHFSARPVPCDNPVAPIALVQVVPTSTTDVVLLCEGDEMPSAAAKYIYRSTNTAKTDAYGGGLGLSGI
jgi:hypothetical protein